jgi:hypothetical protein
MKLKPITKAGIPAALQKAERYRLLNDSSAAESICLDILEIESDNQQALVNLLLSITDQFVDDPTDAVKRAKDVLPRLKDEYKRHYYTGITAERKAKALLKHGGLGGADVAHDWFGEAMKAYEKAESMRPAGNDEAILRWNTCARMLGRHEPKRVGREEYEPAIGE